MPILARVRSAYFLVLGITLLSSCSQARTISLDSNEMAEITTRTSGVWYEADSTINKEGTPRQFSWGTTVVAPNSGLIIETGTIEPYIQFLGEFLYILEIQRKGRKQIYFGVRDANISGSGAFVRVIWVAHQDGTATIDFQRRDSSLYGAERYKRRYGPNLD
jgi:hypothetical protein